MNGYTRIVHAARYFTGLVSVFAACALVNAAEVSGTVALDHHGLFGSKASAQTHVISVALIPGQGQSVKNRPEHLQQIEISGNRMHPAFLTAQKGDRVEFTNRDMVFHELFSLSSGEPVSVQLGKAGGYQATRASFRLSETGTIHFFCRIHNKSYARIDVVDTPYLQDVKPGQSFHFAGLAPGRWKLRLASPAAETQWLDVSALTAPPPLSLTLASRDGGQSAAKLTTQSGIEQLFR